MAERPAEMHRLPEPAGVARLVQPAGEGRAPLAILLPDALGEDGRSEAYVDGLLARGIATLVLGLGDVVDTNSYPVEPAASPSALAVALAWAHEAGFDPAAIAAVGFGLGARAVLESAQDIPVVALYPGCTGLTLPPAGHVLVLQGGDAAQDCAAMPLPVGTALRLLTGAGHAWDAPGAIWPSPGPMLPDPAGGGRLRARTDPAVTHLATQALADWFAAALRADVRSAAR